MAYKYIISLFAIVSATNESERDSVNERGECGWEREQQYVFHKILTQKVFSLVNRSFSPRPLPRGVDLPPPTKSNCFPHQGVDERMRKDWSVKK